MASLHTVALFVRHSIRERASQRSEQVTYAQMRRKQPADDMLPRQCDTNALSPLQRRELLRLRCAVVVVAMIALGLAVGTWYLSSIRHRRALREGIWMR